MLILTTFQALLGTTYTKGNFDFVKTYQTDLPLLWCRRYSHIPVKEREEIGYQCKQLINLGRVAWLQDHAFDAETVQYVDSSFSLENVVLLATRKTGQI